MGLLQLLLAAIVMVINQKFFISGYKSLWHRAPNMDTLVALGSTAAFVYSTYAPLRHDRRPAPGRSRAVMAYMMDFYFEAAAMILTLITVGKMLEARSKGKTTDALKSPDEAGAQDRHGAAGRQGDGGLHRAGAARRSLRGAAPVRTSRWTAWWWRAAAPSTRRP